MGLIGELRDSILEKGKMVTSFQRVSASTLNAGLRRNTCEDHLLDATLPELFIQVRSQE